MLAVIAAFSVVTVLLILFFNRQSDSRVLKQEIMTDRACTSFKQATTYTIAIYDGVASPASVSAQQCDILTITNQDPTPRLIAFGPHDSHIIYDGVTEKELTLNQSLTITLVQTGSFLVHDHAHEVVKANFVVTRH